MKAKDLIAYVSYLFIIALCIYLFFYIKSESYNCMKSPLTYGVQHFKYKVGGDSLPVTCACSTQGASSFVVVTNDSITPSDIPIVNKTQLFLVNSST